MLLKFADKSLGLGSIKHNTHGRLHRSQFGVMGVIIRLILMSK